MHVLRYPSFKTPILNFQMLFNIRNIVQKSVKTYKKNMFRVCGTRSRRICIDLDAYISKKRQTKTKRPCKCKMLS